MGKNANKEASVDNFGNIVYVERNHLKPGPICCYKFHKSEYSYLNSQLLYNINVLTPYPLISAKMVNRSMIYR